MSATSKTLGVGADLGVPARDGDVRQDDVAPGVPTEYEDLAGSQHEPLAGIGSALDLQHGVRAPAAARARAAGSPGGAWGALRVRGGRLFQSTPTGSRSAERFVIVSPIESIGFVFSRSGRAERTWPARPAGRSAARSVA